MGRLLRALGLPRPPVHLVAVFFFGVLATTLVFLNSPHNRKQTGLRIVRAERRPLGRGLEVIFAQLAEGRIDRGRLYVVYADLARVEPELVLNHKLEPLEALLDKGTLLTVNAGYFTAENKPTGLLLSRGERLHRFVPNAGSAGSGVLVILDQAVKLLSRDAVDPKATLEAELAIQAGPRIIEADGSMGIRSDDGARANRTVIGRDGRGFLALAVAYASEAGMTKGPTLFELQRVLSEGLAKFDPQLAFQVALNLDGGPSTGLVVPRAGVRLPASGRRVVSVLRLRPRGAASDAD